MPMRRSKMMEWAEEIKGKMTFELRNVCERITIENIDYNNYRGRITNVIVEKAGQRNIMSMCTDHSRTQDFDSSMELSSDGKLLIDTATEYSYWAVVLQDKEILELKKCDLCLSRCKKDKPCELFDSVYGYILKE